MYIGVVIKAYCLKRPLRPAREQLDVDFVIVRSLSFPMTLLVQLKLGVLLTLEHTTCVVH